MLASVEVGEEEESVGDIGREADTYEHAIYVAIGYLQDRVRHEDDQRPTAHTPTHACRRVRHPTL